MLVVKSQKRLTAKSIVKPPRVAAASGFSTTRQLASTRLRVRCMTSTEELKSRRDAVVPALLAPDSFPGTRADVEGAGKLQSKEQRDTDDADAYCERRRVATY